MSELGEGGAAAEAGAEAGAAGAAAVPADTGGAAAADAGTALGGAAETGTALGGDGEAAPGTQTSAPAEYADFTMPEGVSLTPEQMTGFKDLARTNDFTQEGAQKAVDMHLGLTTALQKQGAEAWEKQVGDWLTTSKTDTEFGGQGYKDSIGVALKAIDKFGTAEFKQALNEYGIGNHPEFIRFAYRVGKAIADDTIHSGGSAGGGQAPANDMEAAARKIYS